MKKAFKILAVIAAVLIVAVAGLTLLAKSYLTDDRIRTLVTQSTEKSLHRKVSLGAVSVSIFSGISVKDFAIQEKDSDQAFMKADAFILKYQLLPLLAKRLIIDELAVESPRIVIRKKADGTFNFSDMTRPNEGGGREEDGKEVSGLPVSLSIKSLSIKKARLEYEDPAGAVARAAVDLDSEIDLQARSDKVIRSSGKATILLAEVQLKNRPKPVKDLPVSVRYRSEVDLADQKIDIVEASLVVFGAEMSLKGRVNYGDPLSYAIEVKAPQVNLAKVQKSAAGFLPEGVGLDGGLSLDLAVEKKPEQDAKSTFRGEIVLKNAAVATKSMRPVFGGTIACSPDRIDLQGLKLMAGGSTANIAGHVLNYATNPDVRIDVSSDMLNLDSLMPTAAAAGSATGTTPAGKDEKEVGPLNSRIRAEGNIDIRRMTFKGVTVHSMKAHYVFRDNIFALVSLTGGTLSGTFRAQARADLSKPGAAYSMTAETQGVKLEEVTAAFAPKAKENLFGSLSARAEINGAGSIAASIRRNLKGKGSFSVLNGKIRNARISDALLTILGLQGLKEIPMEKADGSFTIGGGAVALRSVIANKDLVFSETGTISLDQMLDMSLLVKISDSLSPKIVSQSGVSQFLSEERGWTTVPLRLGGTIAKPSYGIDTQALGKQATRKAGEELFRALTGEKQRKSGEQPAGTQKKKEGGSAEDILKGLFK